MIDNVFIEGSPVPMIPGKPFTAKERIVYTVPLATGETACHSNWIQDARDEDGRVRRERRRFIKPGEDADANLLEFSISDPVSHTKLSCNAISHTCKTGRLDVIDNVFRQLELFKTWEIRRIWISAQASYTPSRLRDRGRW